MNKEYMEKDGISDIKQFAYEDLKVDWYVELK